MELVNEIDPASKSGKFVILQDAVSGSWEVGRWAQETSTWVQIDGKPVRIFPTHWVAVSGDAAGSEDGKDVSFLRDFPQLNTRAPRLLILITFVFLAAMVIISGYAAFDFGLLAARPTKVLSSDKSADSAGLADGSGEDALIRGLATAREKIGLFSEREKAARAEALEAERVADAKQKELKQALDAKTAQADKLARDLAAEVLVTTDRVNDARAEVLRTKQIGDAKEKELKKEPDETTAREEALSRELSSVREIAAARKPGATFGAQDDALQSESHRSHALVPRAPPVATGAVPNTSSSNDLISSTVPAARSAPKPATPEEATAGVLQPPTRQSQSQPAIVISPADEARLIARAEFLVTQADIASARLLLEHGMAKGSTLAIFMLAETYDEPMLRSLKAYGVRPDVEKARELYELAAAAGMEKARERLAALESGSDYQRQ
jgi:hypothetical protein